MRKNSHMTEESKKKMSEAHKGKLTGDKNHFWRGGKVKTICKICGKEIYTDQSKSKKGWGKFCSQKCHGVWSSRNRIGKNSSRWKGGKVKIICKVCNEERYIHPSVLEYGRGMFCSKKCQGIWVARHRGKGENHPCWKGGKSRIICECCGKQKYHKPSVIKKGNGKFCSRRCSTIYKNIHQKKNDTDIERLIEDELIRRNIPYTKQVPLLGMTVVDFLLPHDTVIYCDGDYWHNLPGRKEKDINQDFILNFYGYKVFRFTDKEIKESARKCVRRIKWISKITKM